MKTIKENNEYRKHYKHIPYGEKKDGNKTLRKGKVNTTEKRKSNEYKQKVSRQPTEANGK